MAIPVLKRAQQFMRWATVWPQLTWTEKWGAAEPLSVGGVGSHLTQCRLGRHSDPSNRLATVHRHYRQDRQENGPVAA